MNLRRTPAVIAIKATPGRIVAARRIVERALMNVLGQGFRSEPHFTEYYVSFETPADPARFTFQVTDVEYYKVLIECETVAKAEAWPSLPIEASRG